jgi:hypothetical protein
MIFAAAPPPRANKGSLDPAATATAVAASARSSFREFLMLFSLGFQSGLFP